MPNPGHAMRPKTALLAACLAMAGWGVVAAELPYYRFGGQGGPASPSLAGNGPGLSQTRFTAAPSDAAYHPGAPALLSVPALSGATGATSYALVRNGGDIGPGLGALCPGLGFDPASGAISGTATGSCRVDGLSYLATTPGFPSAASASFTLTVASAFAVATDPAPVTLRAGGSGTAEAAVSGSPYGALSWGVVPIEGATGPVPGWIAKDPSGCAPSSMACRLSLAPASTVPAGTYPATGAYALRAVDASRTSVTSRGFTVTVRQPSVTLAATPLAYAATKGTSQTTQALVPAGGSGSYAYTLETVSGTPPANVTLDQATGSLGFTPDVGQGASWTYRIRVASAGDPDNATTTPTVTVALADAAHGMRLRLPNGLDMLFVGWTAAPTRMYRYEAHYASPTSNMLIMTPSTPCFIQGVVYSSLPGGFYPMGDSRCVRTEAESEAYWTDYMGQPASTTTVVRTWGEIKPGPAIYYGPENAVWTRE